SAAGHRFFHEARRNWWGKFIDFSRSMSAMRSRTLAPCQATMLTEVRRWHLLGLGPRKLHHLAPFLGLVGDELAELGVADRTRRDAQRVGPRLHCGRA